MRLFFRAPSRCHIAEAPHSSNRNIVDPLWLRVALKGAAIFELQHVVARLVGMAIELDHLCEEFLGVKRLVKSLVDGALIIAYCGDLLRTLILFCTHCVT